MDYPDFSDDFDTIKSVIKKKLAPHLTDDTVLVDERAFDYLVRNLPTRLGKTDVINFLRLSLFTECIVLHERVLLPYYETGENWGGFFSSLDQFISVEGLLENSLVQFVWDPYEPDKSLLNVDKIVDQLNKEEIFIYDGSAHLESFLFEYLEDISGDIDLSHMTDPLRWFSYKTKMESAWSDQEGIDRKAYREACKLLYEEITKLTELGRPKSLFIPPITAIVFKSVFFEEESYTETVIKLREKYKKVRKYFQDTNEIIKDEDLSLKKASKARLEVANKMKALHKEHDSYDETYLAQLLSFENLKDIIGNPERFLKNPTSILEYILETPIRKLNTRIKHRNIYFLFSLIRKYRRLEELKQILQKLVSYEISSEITQKTLSYINLTKDSIVR